MCGERGDIVARGCEGSGGRAEERPQREWRGMKEQECGESREEATNGMGSSSASFLPQHTMPTVKIAWWGVSYTEEEVGETGNDGESWEETIEGVGRQWGESVEIPGGETAPGVGREKEETVQGFGPAVGERLGR